MTVISGVVQDTKDNPIVQARVYFTHSPVPVRDIVALTDEKGAFSLTAPAPGSYTIACTAEHFAPAERTVEIEENKGPYHIRFVLVSDKGGEE